MALLRLESGTTYTQLSDITRELALLNIELNYWSIEDSNTLNLLNQENLTDTEKEQVLQGLDSYFQYLKQTASYQDRDLIVLNPQTPNLDGLLAKFNRCHTHADDEVRYIVDGAGVFGFVLPDNSQVELTVYPQEYINVPARTLHWFYLTDTKRIKAVRYFVGTDGWIPEYQDIPIRIKPISSVSLTKST